MTTKYIRKQVVVEAIQFDPDAETWPKGVEERKGHWSEINKTPGRNFGFIGPGTVGRVRPGDWIVTNPTGERYVVLQEYFFDVYEPVTE